MGDHFFGFVCFVFNHHAIIREVVEVDVPIGVPISVLASIPARLLSFLPSPHATYQLVPNPIQADDFENEDKMSLHLVNIIKTRMGVQALTSLHAHFDDHDECRVMVVKCRKSPMPVFLKDADIERFYIRTGPSTTELSASQTQEYIKHRFRS